MGVVVPGVVVVVAVGVVVPGVVVAVGVVVAGVVVAGVVVTVGVVVAGVVVAGTAVVVQVLIGGASRRGAQRQRDGEDPEQISHDGPLQGTMVRQISPPPAPRVRMSPGSQVWPVSSSSPPGQGSSRLRSPRLSSNT